jgi:predicted nucleotidyltransferase
LISSDKYLILQYGSSLFGSETKDSDFDLILLFSQTDLEEYCEDQYGFEPNIREAFFFKDLVKSLTKNNPLSVIKVFDVRNAKVPILKVKYRDQLSLDLSLGLVSNQTIQGISVSMLHPADSETESVL